MSTRGLWGYAIGGATKLAYNHYDSYPGYLGERILKHAQWAAANVEMATRLATDLRVVDKDSEPTEADVERLRPWTDLNVASQSTSDWYCLTRRAQGDPEATLAAGVMLDAGDFAADSLYCEWGYVIDLDGRQFEVYEGFQDGRHFDGRFSELPKKEAEYWPIRLLKSWGFHELPDSLAMLEGDDDE